jgi:hypothetical protein
MPAHAPQPRRPLELMAKSRRQIVQAEPVTAGRWQVGQLADIAPNATQAVFGEGIAFAGDVVPSLRFNCIFRWAIEVPPQRPEQRPDRRSNLDGDPGAPLPFGSRMPRSHSTRDHCRITYWVLRLPAGATKCLGKPMLCSDRFHEVANAENAHHPIHAVGQTCKRHFGADVPENFHLEVRRSHPGLYRAKGCLDPKMIQSEYDA